MTEWIKFSERRPDKDRGLYWFRVGTVDFGGTHIAPEWVDEVRRVGMGYRDPELWPSFSHWDGWNRSVPPLTEWREDESAAEGDERYPGLGMTGCPFCGAEPKIKWSHQSICGGWYVGSRIYKANAFSIVCPNCGMANTHYSSNLAALIARWNNRT